MSAEYWALQAGTLRQERDEARAGVERLRAAATAYLLEQTQENANALAEVAGLVPRRDKQVKDGRGL